MTENKKERVPMRALVGCILDPGKFKCKGCAYRRACEDKARGKLKENQELVIV